MRRVLERAPDYHRGWSLLLEWLIALNRGDEALEAAQRLVRLAPRSPVPLGYLADLQSRLGRNQEALASLERAFAMDPQYVYAGLRLFDHRIGAQDYRGAEEILEQLRMHAPGPRTEAARIRLLCARFRTDKAIELLAELCTVPARETLALQEAIDAVRGAGWHKAAEAVLRERLSLPEANLEVGTLWVDCFVNGGDWGKRKRISRIPLDTPMGRQVRVAFIRATGDHRKVSYLLDLIGRERSALRKDTACGTGRVRVFGQWADA